MTTLISFAALFIAILFVQLGSGTLGPLDALSGAALGFSTREIGLLGSAHYVGFFVGCWATPRLMASVGHERAFAFFAAVGTMGALLHPVIIDPYAWAAMRAGTGLAVAGGYTIIESWLHAKTPNSARGRVLGVFRLVDLMGQLGAQGLIAVLEPGSYVAYNIVALFCVFCLVPLVLTTRRAPAWEGAPRLRPWRAAQIAPLSAMTAMAMGLTGASFRMVGPIYGAERGLDLRGIALFLGAAVLGGALAQLPVGWLSDRIDRRRVLVGLSVGALAVSLATARNLGGDGGIYFLSFLFGATSFPLYSVAAAHANDSAPSDFIVELNASLMFLFGVGAIVSPLLAAQLISAYGPAALFAYVAAAHALLVVFGLYRMTQRPSRAPRTPYEYTPRTSFTLGRLLRRR